MLKLNYWDNKMRWLHMKPKCALPSSNFPREARILGARNIIEPYLKVFMKRWKFSLIYLNERSKITMNGNFELFNISRESFLRYLRWYYTERFFTTVFNGNKLAQKENIYQPCLFWYSSLYSVLNVVMFGLYKCCLIWINVLGKLTSIKKRR